MSARSSKEPSNPLPGTDGRTHAEANPTERDLLEAERLQRAGKNVEAVELLQGLQCTAPEPESQVRVLLLRARAMFDAGKITDSLVCLESAAALAAHGTPSLQLAVTLPLFMTKSDFLAPDELLSTLASLRQLASSVGDAASLASLHLAVTRVEGCRGHCIDARRHVEIARKLSAHANQLPFVCLLDNVEAALELAAGNLARSKRLAESCLDRARSAGLSSYRLGAATNLAIVELYRGQLEHSRRLFEGVLSEADGITYIRFGALDSFALLELREGKTDRCLRSIDRCSDLLQRDSLPARSWYDFAHQITRCAYYEHLEDWTTIIDIVEDADAELIRRQYKALRTSLLCAKARAFARLGRHTEAATALAAAVRACPRGAVDPLIVLEASKALCATLRGDVSAGSVHYDRALAGCRAIGHRYHEWWIERDRADVRRRTTESLAVTARDRDLTETSLLVGDVAAMLGAGHSIDLLGERLVAILHSTRLAGRVEVHSESGHPYHPEPTAAWDTEPDGTITIRLRGSDRRISVRVRHVASIDEVSLLKSLTDVLQAAVNRTVDTETEDEDLNLWPKVVHDGEDSIFRSPRMVEFVRIAERLAATNLPILITGETGTGKEVVARLIHDRSLVKRGPFVAFNCSAMPRDLVESQLFGHRRGAFTGALDAFPGVIRAADRGTLFLDEIGDLDPATQPKLLRFLERGEIQPVGDVRPQLVPVRIVAATNSNLKTLADQGQFRRDLFYRLGVAHLELPPLRERKDEIPAFAALFLSRFARECGRANLRMSDDFMAALLLYDWPGNVRQLANEIRRAAAMAADGQAVTAADLSPEVAERWNTRPTAAPAPTGPTVAIRLDQPMSRAIADLERHFIAHAMQAADGRVAEAAQLLGLSRKGLFLKRRRQGFVAG